MTLAIKLGPILGIEGDYEYTMMILLEEEIDRDDLVLDIQFLDQNTTKTPSAVHPLRNHFLYRFSFPVTASQESYEVIYRLQHGEEFLGTATGVDSWKFVVPGEETIPKVGFASCNGDAKKLPDEMSDDEFDMWDRLYESHVQEGLDYSFHCLLLCGDQVYADPIWDRVSYFQDERLLGCRTSKKMAKHKIETSKRANLVKELEEFYENLYISCWSKPAISKVLASIPSVMMWDDHDIIDGWGSYSHALQNCDLFGVIFEVSRKYFELLQIRTADNDMLIGSDHYSQKLSFRNYEILVLDNRSCRSQTQIMSDRQYSEIHNIAKDGFFQTCPDNLRDQKILLFAIPVPIAHLNYSKRAEQFVRWLFKHDFRKSFDDDALDHWDHHQHEQEQERLIGLLYDIADQYEPKYVHIVSGDVHSAGAGRIERTQGTRRIINQLISSAIVYKPVGKIEQFLMKFASKEASKIRGYLIRTDNFGIGKNAQPIIYERNFGFLYKAKDKGTKFYLSLESSRNPYEWDQPRVYNPDL